MEVNKWLYEARIYLKEGTLVNATIIEALTSIKNKTAKREPNMHQTKKGNKAHIGADVRRGLTHTFTITTANERDLNQTKHLIHGDETFIGADSGYHGAQKREELKNVTAGWLIAEMPSKMKVLRKHPRINKLSIKTEFIKASIRTKVENPFRIIKCQFDFVKARYRGLAKNDNKLAMLFALANAARIDQMIRATRDQFNQSTQNQVNIDLTWTI